MAELRREFFRRRFWSDAHSYGIRCPSCQQLLKLRKWRAQVLLACIYPALIFGSTLMPHVHIDRDIAEVLTFGGLAAVMVICVSLAPRLVRLALPRPGETILIERPFEERLAQDPDYQHDMQELDEHEKWSHTVNSPSRRDWRCTKCGEENPANFDICWKCQSSNPSARP